LKKSVEASIQSSLVTVVEGKFSPINLKVVDISGNSQEFFFCSEKSFLGFRQFLQNCPRQNDRTKDKDVFVPDVEEIFESLFEQAFGAKPWINVLFKNASHRMALFV
jgi:hypothetical protein